MRAFLSSSRVLAAGLIAAHLALGAYAVFALAQTYDEGDHLASGYAFWKSGEFRMDAVFNTPLARLIAALPLLAANPDAMLGDRAYKAGDCFGYAERFMHENRVPAERMLHAGRLTLLFLLGPLLAWAVYRWAGAAALFFYALNPVILANAALITSDFTAAVFVALCLQALSRMFVNDSITTKSCLILGLLLGAALASKHSAALLFVILPAAAAAYCALTGRRVTGRDAVRLVAAALAGALAVVVLSYGPKEMPVWWRGIVATFTQVSSQAGHSFLMGRVSEGGWWYYFPFSFLVKTPIPLLLLLAVALASARTWLRDPRKQALLAFAVLPAVMWLAASCFSRRQVGVRHILPIFPLACVVAGTVFSDLWRQRGPRVRCALALLALWYAAGTLRLAPHYLAYFNEAAGGPEGGRRLLADSNLDWGQSLKALGAYLREEGSPPIYLSYFGTADPHIYGIRYVPIAWVAPQARQGDPVEPFRAPRTLFAISATNHASVYYQGYGLDMARGLAALKPQKVLGHSILVYDLTGHSEVLRGLADILLRQNDRPRAEALLEWLSVQERVQ